MELKTKQFIDSILTLVDSDTQAPIQATFSNIELSTSDESIFTTSQDVDGDGTIDIVGVAAGTGTLHVKADATYIDSKTNKEVTATKETDVEVTVTEPEVGAENTELKVTFSDPKDVPA